MNTSNTNMRSMLQILGTILASSPLALPAAMRQPSRYAASGPAARAFRTSFAEVQPSYRHYQALSDNKNSLSLNLHRNLVENILIIIIHRGAISISGTLSIRLRFSTHAAIFYVCEYGSRLDMHSPPTGTTDAPGHPPTPPLATHWPPAHAAMTL